MSISMFLKKLRHDYFLRKKEYYYELYKKELKKELKKEETSSRTTYNIDGKEVTITNYTEHVPFFIRREDTPSFKTVYYNRYLYYSNKLLKHQI